LKEVEDEGDGVLRIGEAVLLTGWSELGDRSLDRGCVFFWVIMGEGRM